MESENNKTIIILYSLWKQTWIITAQLEHPRWVLLLTKIYLMEIEIKKRNKMMGYKKIY